MKRKLILFAGVLGVLLLAAGVFGGVFVRGRLERAQRLSERGLYSHARTELETYLSLFSRDHEARLLMAEVLVNDPTLSKSDAVHGALEQLQRIPDGAPVGARARVQEAKLLMLTLHQMGRAERVLQHVREIAPDEREAHFLYWKLLDLTGRSYQAEPVFWKLYELVPKDEAVPSGKFPIRADLLRQWYLSQFFPPMANAELERQMGLIGPNETATTENESQRFDYLKKTEPDSPIGYAALGQWFIQEEDHKFALKMLDEAVGKVPDEELLHPFYVATKVHCLMDLGQYDEAVALMDEWPEPREGYDYLKWKAIILQEVEKKREEALEVYDQALACWPGPVDWQLRHKKFRCLAELKRPEEAEREHQRELGLADMMKREVHEPVRIAMDDPSKPENLETIAKFYDRLELPRVAAAWRSQIEVLPTLGGRSDDSRGETGPQAN